MLPRCSLKNGGSQAHLHQTKDNHHHTRSPEKNHDRRVKGLIIKNKNKKPTPDQKTKITSRASNITSWPCDRSQSSLLVPLVAALFLPAAGEHILQWLIILFGCFFSFLFFFFLLMVIVIFWTISKKHSIPRAAPSGEQGVKWIYNKYAVINLTLFCLPAFFSP